MRTNPDDRVSLPAHEMEQKQARTKKLKLQTELPEGVSPFDIIRRIDDGGEFWSARELAPLLGYSQYIKFESAIERAKSACQNSGHDVDEQFAGAAQSSAMPNGGVREMADYRLTRYACYLTALNGDPRKTEIAAAQTYFAVQTRKAEQSKERQLEVQIPADPLEQALLASLTNIRRLNVIDQKIDAQQATIDKLVAESKAFDAKVRSAYLIAAGSQAALVQILDSPHETQKARNRHNATRPLSSTEQTKLLVNACAHRIRKTPQDVYHHLYAHFDLRHQTRVRIAADKANKPVIRFIEDDLKMADELLAMAEVVLPTISADTPSAE